jgi:Icc-related predicted phosphoesterase
MKILAFSDLHHSASHAAALVQASANADLVIGAGDFCNARKNLPQAMGLLSGLAAPMVVIPGNAESVTELTQAVSADTTVLHGSSVTIDGITLFGLGYATPETPFGDWSCDLSEDDARGLLAPCTQADILITHSPPKGIADKTSTGVSVGSIAVFEAIERIQPKLVLCGHIHDSWGQTGHIGRSKIVNLGPHANWFDISA